MCNPYHQPRACEVGVCEINHLIMSYRRLLQSSEVKRDPEQYIHVLQRVIASMTHGIDVSKLFSEMIMVSGTLLLHMHFIPA